jgi:class 3 adenylate cyclase
VKDMLTMPSRRAFLTGTAAAAVAAAVPAAAGAMDAVKRAGPMRLRIGLASPMP